MLLLFAEINEGTIVAGRGITGLSITGKFIS